MTTSTCLGGFSISIPITTRESTKNVGEAIGIYQTNELDIDGGWVCQNPVVCAIPSDLRQSKMAVLMLQLANFVD